MLYHIAYSTGLCLGLLSTAPLGLIFILLLQFAPAEKKNIFICTFTCRELKTKPHVHESTPPEVSSSFTGKDVGNDWHSGVLVFVRCDGIPFPNLSS